VTFLEPTDCDSVEWKESCKTAFERVNPGALGDLNRDMVDDLANGDNLSLVVSAGSLTNQWDLDAISEHFLRAPGGGAVAYFGKNSSYGFDHAPPRHFFRNVYRLNVEHLGEATGLATDAVADAPLGAGVHWNLLGDPELPLWTQAPDTLKLTITPSTLGSMGAQTITIEVEDYGTSEDIEGARVCLKQTDLAYAVDWTGSDGKAVFTSFTPLSSDSIAVVVTARNYLPKQTKIKFEDLAGEDYIVYQSHTRDDDVTGGDSDDVLEAGEAVDLRVLARNVGTGLSEAEGIIAYLWPTPAITFHLDIEGRYEPENIYIGAEGAHPADSTHTALADSFRLPANREAIRHEGEYTPAGGFSQNSFLVWRDTTAVWHVKARYALDSDSDLEGLLVSPGGFHSVGGIYDSGVDTVIFNASDPDTIRFEFHWDATADELTFRTDSTTWVDVLTDSVRLGSMAGGDTASGVFSVSWTGKVPDEDTAVFTLAVVDTNRDWSFSDFHETVHAPNVRQLVQKGKVTGATTLTLAITPTLVNTGSATADSARAIFHRTSTAPPVPVVEDSMVTVLSIGPGDTAQAEDSFDLLGLGFSGLTYDLEIRTFHPNGDSTIWIRENLTVTVPDAPTELITDERARTSRVTTSSSIFLATRPA
jgi:hypothetical protein